MKQTIALIGVPSSAGAHWPGQEKAPTFLRSAGLPTRLRSLGLDVIDCGDLPSVRFRPDPKQRQQQSLDTVVEVCRSVADRVDSALRRKAIPLVIGGDCTIGLGVVAGFVRHYPNLGLVYLDGHVDLNTPVSSPSGILDSMGVAHLIGVPGTAQALSHVGDRFPLMPEDRIVLFGYNTAEINASERDQLAERSFQRYPLAQIRNSPGQAAREARAYLERHSDRFIVHFDVDVIDFTDFPAADVPQFSRGLMFSEVMECVAEFTGGQGFRGLTVTEFNPDHTDEDGELAARFIDSLGRVLADLPQNAP